MNKIGFHTGPGGNPTGIGEYFRRLDEAGQRFVIKTVDHAGYVYEAQQYTNADHVMVYRKSGAGYDVPDYSLSPYAAAQQHWDRHYSARPQELDFSRVWMETTNEPDKNRAEWLADFAYHTALLAVRDNVKYLAFGWSAGEPEPEHWDSAEMRRFLLFAQEFPSLIGVALHEYAFGDSLQPAYNHLIGRFMWLYNLCYSWNIRPPTTVITEFGWNAFSAPDASAVMPQIVWAQEEVYGLFPSLLGAAIWYLGEGYDNICNTVQRYIAPVTDYALQLPVGVQPPGTQPPTPPVVPILDKYVYVVPDIRWLNLRAEPDITATDVGDLHPGGGPLRVIGEKGDWWQVAAWAHKDYLEEKK